MADQWQFQINDGPWHNIRDGQSYCATIPYASTAVKINHRIKPKRTDTEIVAKLREDYGDLPGYVGGLTDLGLRELRKILRGDF